MMRMMKNSILEPLETIQMSSEILAGHLPSSGIQADKINAIKMSTSSLLHKTKDFIDIESITAKTFKNIFHHVHIRETIEEVINTLKFLKQAKPVKVALDCD